MPSPLAHSSLVLLTPGLLQPRRLQGLSRYQRVGLLVAIWLLLCLPDVDFFLLLLPRHPLFNHGTFMHSVVATVAVAVLFATVMSYWLRGRLAWSTLMLAGLLAYGSHLLLDYFTPGRGIMLLWPLASQRFSSPIPLFYGAEHSKPWAWHLHLITLVTELAFAGGVWLLGRWLTTRKSNARSNEQRVSFIAQQKGEQTG